MTKKVLIITYYWPPAGGPGVQRVLKFAKYLPEFGWEPIILTIEGGDYHAMDESLLNDIPPNIKIYKVRSRSALDIYKKLKSGKGEISSFELTRKDGGLGFKLAKWIRANLFIPDARKGWNSAAVKLGLKIIQEEKPNLIFTSSPPHSLQLIGNKLKRKTGIKWVADFRDPWTDAFWDKDLPRMKLFQKYNAYLEQKVVKHADERTTVSLGFSELLKKNSNRRFNLLPNGFDEYDFKGFDKILSPILRITYVGSISNSQNPENFFRAIGQLPQSYKKLIDINFYGKFDSEVKISSQEYGGITKFHGYIPHSEAINKIINSEVLLLLIPKNSKGIITGKLYEYLATKNYILSIGPKENEINEILDLCNAGASFSFNEKLTEAIKAIIDNWKDGITYEINNAEVLKYSRRNITKDLVKIFNSMS